MAKKTAMAFALGLLLGLRGSILIHVGYLTIIAVLLLRSSVNWAWWAVHPGFASTIGLGWLFALASWFYTRKGGTCD